MTLDDPQFKVSNRANRKPSMFALKVIENESAKLELHLHFHKLSIELFDR